MMKNSINNWQITNELQGVILVSFSLVIYKLYLSNQITLILSSNMIPFVLISMVGMFIIGWFRIINRDMYGADCGCEACDLEGSSVFGLLQYIFLFIIPMMIAFNLENYLLSDLYLDGQVLNSHIEKTIEVFMRNPDNFDF